MAGTTYDCPYMRLLKKIPQYFILYGNRHFSPTAIGNRIRSKAIYLPLLNSKVAVVQQ